MPMPMPMSSQQPLASTVLTEARNRAQADAMPAANLQSGLAASPQPQASLAAWLQRQPSQLAWRVDGGPATAASLPWLQRLAGQTALRWQRSSSAPPAQVFGTLQLLAEGDTVAQLWLGADEVLWCNPAKACNRVHLTPSVMSTLQKELPR